MDNSFYGQLKVFQTIAQEGSVSAAARKLEIATPSASQSLKLLEQKIGVPLFARTTRSIALTDAGKRLLERTKQAMETLHQAFEEVKDFGGQVGGMVRITMARVVYQLVLRPHLEEFHQRHPHIRLEISLNDGLSHLIEDGMDLGIRFGNRLDEGMVARKLLDEMHEGLYVSQSYAKKHGIPKTPKDLPAHTLIGYRFISSNKIEPLVISQNGQETAVEMPTPLICNDPEILLDATRQGLGIGRIFTRNMQQQPDRTDFIPVLQKHWRRYPPLYLYYLQHSQRTAKVQAVIEFLLEKTTQYR